MSSARTFLLIEDNDDDAFLLRRAFGRIAGCAAVTCRSNAEAQAYLDGKGMYADRAAYPLPVGIICDFKLGAQTANDFLRWIKTIPSLAAIPVFVLTGAAPTDDLPDAQKLGAAALMRKPQEPEELEVLMQQFVIPHCK